MSPTTSIRDLSGDQVAAVFRLLDRAAQSDGGVALDEAARMRLRAPVDRPGTGVGDAADAPRHIIASDYARIVGYVSVLEDGTIQGMVDPDHRRRGHGSALLAEALRHTDSPGVWLHVPSEESARFLEHRGLVPVRHLHVVCLSENAIASLAVSDVGGVESKESVGFRTLETERPGDLDQIVHVNSLAFADHPEQGRMSLAELQVKMAERWFDPARLYLADADGELAAFVWVKVDGAEREIYVVATHPDYAGRGFARTLMARALADLGCTPGPVILYVDGENARAVRLYERLGFRITTTHVQYRPRGG